MSALATTFSARTVLGGAGSFGVRPVAYLNSEITVEDLHVINGQEDDWSTYSNDFTVAHGGTDNGEAGNYGTPGRPHEVL